MYHNEVFMIILDHVIPCVVSMILHRSCDHGSRLVTLSHHSVIPPITMATAAALSTLLHTHP